MTKPPTDGRLMGDHHVLADATPFVKDDAQAGAEGRAFANFHGHWNDRLKKEPNGVVRELRDNWNTPLIRPAPDPVECHRVHRAPSPHLVSHIIHLLGRDILMDRELQDMVTKKLRVREGLASCLRVSLVPELHSPDPTLPERLGCRSLVRDQDREEQGAHPRLQLRAQQRGVVRQGSSQAQKIGSSSLANPCDVATLDQPMAPGRHGSVHAGEVKPDVSDGDALHSQRAPYPPD